MRFWKWIIVWSKLSEAELTAKSRKICKMTAIFATLKWTKKTKLLKNANAKVTSTKSVSMNWEGEKVVVLFARLNSNQKKNKKSWSMSKSCRIDWFPHSLIIALLYSFYLSIWLQTKVRYKINRTAEIFSGRSHL